MRNEVQKKLSIGSCFSGIGGLELGLEWTGGFETKWQIEIDPYASAVLAKHWPNAKRFSDIQEFAYCAGCPDCGNPDCGQVTDWMPVDVICGGFPCQDVSLAGARSGLKGKRSTLWGEMHRLVRTLRPEWVVAENVPGLFSSDDGRFFGNILRDMALAGYDAEWGVLSANGVGAPHLRRRVFILGHSDVYGRNGSQDRQGDRARANGDAEGAHEFCEPARSGGSGERDVADSQGKQNGGQEQPRLQPNAGTGREVAHTKGTRLLLRRVGIRQATAHAEPIQRGHIPNAELNRLEEQGNLRIQRRPPDPIADAGWWAIEPNVGRVAHGVPSRVDRLRCLGNAVVPQVAQKIGEMILKSIKS